MSNNSAKLVSEDILYILVFQNYYDHILSEKSA
jgi:hypothetical protein